MFLFPKFRFPEFINCLAVVWICKCEITMNYGIKWSNKLWNSKAYIPPMLLSIHKDEKNPISLNMEGAITRRDGPYKINGIINPSPDEWWNIHQKCCLRFPRAFALKCVSHGSVFALTISCTCSTSKSSNLIIPKILMEMRMKVDTNDAPRNNNQKIIFWTPFITQMYNVSYDRCEKKKKPTTQGKPPFAIRAHLLCT